MVEPEHLFNSKQIIFCRCRGERIDPGLLVAVEKHLRGIQVNITILSDLCGLIAQKRELLPGIFKSGGEYLVIGCYPRAMDLLFGQIKNVKRNSMGFNHINLLELTSEQVIVQINEFCQDQKANTVYKEITEDSGWLSWYPLIDYSRCTACGQCADFCLFGVYEKSEDRVAVVNPGRCKINCPACARICPSTAIIFPKYRNGGAVGGSDEIDEYSEHRRQVKDNEEFLGADIYEALKNRKIRRQSVIREEAMRKAHSERDDAIKGISKN